MEMQINNKITQKKGEIKKDYKGKQKLIVHKLGNVLPKTHSGYNILRFIKSHFNMHKTPVLPSWMSGLKNPLCLDGPHSHTLYQLVTVIILTLLMGKII